MGASYCRLGTPDFLQEGGRWEREKCKKLVVAGDVGDDRRDWGKMIFSLIDNFALYLRLCALQMCIFLILTIEIKHNGHIETRPQV